MGFSFLILIVFLWVFPSAIPYANPSSHNGGIFKEAILMQPLPDLGPVIPAGPGSPAAAQAAEDEKTASLNKECPMIYHSPIHIAAQNLIYIYVYISKTGIHQYHIHTTCDIV